MMTSRCPCIFAQACAIVYPNAGRLTRGHVRRLKESKTSEIRVLWLVGRERTHFIRTELPNDMCQCSMSSQRGLEEAYHTR